MELAQHQKMPAADWLEWSTRMLKQEQDRLFEARLSQGKGRRVVFSPFLGEFGHKIMHHARLVHFSAADYKIVCIQPGDEVLYPAANEFFYDWQHPIPDAQREGADRYIRQWPEIQAKYPDCLLVQSGGLGFAEEKRPIYPEKRLPFKDQTTPFCSDVDVCIGTRSRGLNPRQNWEHCQLIADACRARGLHFATIGGKDVGYHLDGENYYTGDYEEHGLEMAIGALQRAKLYFGQDSGVAHLASTIGINMAVLQVPHRIWALQDLKAQGLDESCLGAYGRDFIDRMQEINAPFETHRIAPELWFDPEAVVQAIEPALDNIAYCNRIRGKSALETAPEVISRLQALNHCNSTGEYAVYYYSNSHGSFGDTEVTYHKTKREAQDFKEAMYHQDAEVLAPAPKKRRKKGAA